MPFEELIDELESLNTSYLNERSLLYKDLIRFGKLINILLQITISLFIIMFLMTTPNSILLVPLMMSSMAVFYLNMSGRFSYRLRNFLGLIVLLYSVILFQQIIFPIYFLYLVISLNIIIPLFQITELLINADTWLPLFIGF